MQTEWDPDAYVERTAYVPRMGRALVEALAAKPHERVLDVGCGDGTLSIAIAQSGAEVVGVDASEPMVLAARSRGINAHCADMCALKYNTEFDAVFSHVALHWLPEERHPSALAALWNALKPGGRLVAELGGRGNIGAVLTALRAVLSVHNIDISSPFCFPTAERYTFWLEAAGFESVRVETRHEAVSLEPAGIDGWFDVLGAPMLTRLPASARTAAREHIKALVAPSLRDEHDRWWMDCIRLRIVAYRPR